MILESSPDSQVFVYAGAVFATAAVSVLGANSAAHTRDQTGSEADKGYVCMYIAHRSAIS